MDLAHLSALQFYEVGRKIEPTDSANDRGTAIVLFGLVFSIQAGSPFQFGPVFEVIQSVTHDGNRRGIRVAKGK